MSAAGKYKDELIATANQICTAGKGILAADESTGTIGKRFAAINVENNEENRHAYRSLLFTSGPELAESISGVIMFEETLYSKTAEGETFPALLKRQGIVTGIKTDKGVQPIGGTDGETATQGLTDLGKRSAAYYEAGARFAKWRNVLKINVANGQPSALSVADCAHTLARYASISQQNGLVPIVEPEILMDGEHSIEVCAAVTERVLSAVFKALADHHVLLEGCLLKPNMVLPGSDFAGGKATPNDVGMYTVRTLLRTVPAALPGVVFLSGGQSEAEATRNLNGINNMPKCNTWHLTFSYGRALQASCLDAWQGKKENVEAAQKVLLGRCKANSDAQKGEYKGDGDNADKSLFVKGYTY